MLFHREIHGTEGCLGLAISTDADIKRVAFSTTAAAGSLFTSKLQAVEVESGVEWMSHCRVSNTALLLSFHSQAVS